eukprot:41502-Eustigmatos_ZCMA.PRE.1
MALRGLQEGQAPAYLCSTLLPRSYTLSFKGLSVMARRGPVVLAGDILTFIGAGGCAGLSYWTAVYPVDT